MLVLAALLAAVAVPAAQGAVGSVQVSSNWAGYAVTAPAGSPPLSFGDVTGTWQVPRVSCSSGRSTSSAFWVGTGGFGAGSPSLQQLGSSADCDPGGKATYSLWTEIVPAPAHFLSMRVRPGDRITAAVVVDGQRVTMSLKDTTLGTRYSASVVATQPLDTSSAEWIAEAPSLCRTITSCSIVPLSDFGTVGFSNVAAVANGHPGTITDPFWQATPIALVTSDGMAGYTPGSNVSGAVPALPSANGRSFQVAYRSRLGGTPPPAPEPGAPLPPWAR